MVSPILLIAVPLGAAFLLPLFDRLGRTTARAVHLLVLLFCLGVSGWWLLALMHGGAPAEILTGGWPPPIGINLRLGVLEAGLVVLAVLSGLGSALYLAHHEEQGDLRGLVIQLLLVAGATGLIMTRDLFNTFVFLEISGIGAYAIVAFGREREGLEAGFKYMMIGSIASVLVLLGIAFLYKTTGTLNIDDMIGRLPMVTVAGMGTVLLLFLVGLMIELKLFPLNGPAIDLYDGVEPGVMALLVGTVVNAVLYTFWKVQPFYAGAGWKLAIEWVGMATFLVANLLAIRQKRVRRMLGYSSSAQIGLLVFLLPLLADHTVALGAGVLLLVNHTLAKAALLWLAGVHGGERIHEWRGAFTGTPVLRIVLAASVLAIAGMPPFPGFWGKWQALAGLASSQAGWWIAPLLVGSLFELAYYFRWLGTALEAPRGATGRVPAPGEMVGAGVFAALGIGLGARALAPLWGGVTGPLMALAGLGLALVILRTVPGGVQALVSLAALLATAWSLLSGSHGCPLWSLEGLFAVVTLFGAMVVALAALGLPARRSSYHGLFLILVASVLGIVLAPSLLGFFAGWELMTWSSYLLITQGREGTRPGFVYILFSGAAGFLVLGGLMVALGAGATTVASLVSLGGGTALAAWGLLALGFAVKVASWGAHIWAPAAYSEAPDLFTPFLSGVISKVPIFALAALAARIAVPAVTTRLGALDLTHVLGWVGGVTAFGMTLLAVFQEDAKRLLAYSSVGQVGYIVLALAVMTPLGWSAALYHAVNHMLFKALLFVAVAGVILRTGTRDMSEMGGLIKRMPVSFVAVLIGIIALSGVPPLSGFTGKWLLYEALVEKGWLLLAGLSMFASAAAFPYLFRLIHSIFLGQLKTENREIREAPWPVLMAEVLLIVPIMVLSVWPQALLAPVQRLVTGIFGQPGLAFADAATMTTRFGYFNAVAMMVLAGSLFVLLLLFLLFSGPKPVKVKQLDIVYAGEVPPPPEQIHFAHAFFAPYEKAFKPLLRKTVTEFWSSVADVTEAIADAGRRFYTGNGQTYLLYSILFILLLAAAGLAG